MAFIFFNLAGNPIQLVPDGSLIFHGLIILFMVLVLNRTLFKPINRVLEERYKSTRGLMAEAQQTLTGIDQSIRQYQQALRGARAEGYQLLELQRSEAIRERERQIASVRESLIEQASSEKEQIELQAEVARTALAKEARSLALRISSQILGRPVRGEHESD